MVDYSSEPLFIRLAAMTRAVEGGMAVQHINPTAKAQMGPMITARKVAFPP